MLSEQKNGIHTKQGAIRTKDSGNHTKRDGIRTKHNSKHTKRATPQKKVARFSLFMMLFIRGFRICLRLMNRTERMVRRRINGIQF